MPFFPLLTFLTIAAGVYAGLNYYLYQKAIQLFGQPSPSVTLAFFAFATLMFLSQILVHSHDTILARPLSWLAFLWLGFIFVFFSLHALIDLVWWLPGRYFPQVSAQQLTAATFLLVVAVCVYGFFSARSVTVEKVTLTSPRIERPLTLVQLSDVHLGLMSYRTQIRALVAQVNALQPDIIVSTGDLVDRNPWHLDEFAQELTQLHAPLGKFAILGNHEAFTGVEASTSFMQQAGFQLLSNAGMSVGGINIVGVDDPAVGIRNDVVTISEQELLARFPQGYTVLLKHQPVIDGADGFDLQLSGHTHGGQIFPFGLLTRLAYHHPSGLSRVGPRSQLYLSRGTGSWGPPLRVGSAPEITVIRLQRTAP